MCGFAAIVTLNPKRFTATPEQQQAQEKRLHSMLTSIAHRGDPEHFGEMHVEGNFALGTNRLAIVDRGHAQQPVADVGENVYVAFNGEIYNFETLRNELVAKGSEFKTHSDTEVIANGYMEWGIDLLNKLDGIFGFIVIDHANQSFLAARDHIGIKPLYFSEKDGVFYFSSEQKALLGIADEITTVSPSCYVKDGKIGRYYDLDKAIPALLSTASEQELIAEFKHRLTEAVRKQVQTDLPLAVMFSAGIDSTLMLHLARKYHNNVTAFTIGLEGAVDVPIAEQYCKEQGIPHYVYKLTQEELVEMLPNVAVGSEFFEGIDAIDACVAYFGYRFAREKGFKVALCGEGSDEVLAGYYDLFREHPEPEVLKHYRVHNLHRTDLQRVDRASMLNSVEARVPFLDKDFLELAYHVPMSLKMRNNVEKWILREAFRDELPAYLIDRPKVRMPEGSGVKNILMDFAGTQDVDLSEDIKTALALETPQSEYFLSLHLNAGFPLPKERQRFAGFDFSGQGYFAFAASC